MAYQRILAAVDLSEESGQVLDRAREMADSHSAQLAVITVIKPLSQVYGGLSMAPLASASVSFEEQALDQAKLRLRELAGGYGVAAEHCHVPLGSPATEIQATARELGSDLIVIGTHGRQGLERLLGSTANAVLHGVRRDVLAVRIDESGQD
ncbi:MAG: universal stress protein [Pseudomonadales bacterium]